jgi:hypothetical protein
MSDDEEPKKECENCGELVEEDTLLEMVNSRLICEDCMEESQTCDRCNESFLEEDGYSNEQGTYCSERCYDHDWTTCDNCDCTVEQDNITDGLCSDCYENQDGEYNQLSNEPDFKFFQTEEKKFFNTKDFTIGIELETNNVEGIRHFSDASENMTSEEIQLLKTRIDAKEDGSLCDSGVEFTTLPTSNDETYKTVKVLTKFLNKNGFKIDNRCGYHLHIGEKRGTSPAKLDIINRHKIMIVYSIFNKTLFDFCTPTRVGNGFCDNERFTLRAELFTKAAQKEPERYYREFIRGRYNLINFCAFEEHNTLEIRSHEGTIDETAVFNWLRLHTELFEFAINSTYKDLLVLRGTWSDLKKVLRKQRGLISYYLKKRQAYLKTKTRKSKLARLQRTQTIIVNDIKSKRKIPVGTYGRDFDFTKTDLSSVVIPELVPLVVE